MSKTNWSLVQRTQSEKSHKAALSEAEARAKKFADALSDTQRQLEVALALTKSSTQAKAIPLPATGADNEATAVAVGGDWHSEETVDPRTVNGLNEFSLDIADRRITRFFQAIVRLTEIERSGTKIENLVLALLGDLITGEIHEELEENNGLSATQTVLWLRKRIVGGLRYLLKHGGYKRIVVVCNYGNHGRNTKKPRHATGAAHSYEWMLYQVLREDVPEVEWVIADGYFAFFDIYGRTFRFHHGDNVQYGGGVGGLTIPTEKAIAQWNKSRPVYCDIFGHHHQAMQNPRWICNGSLIGYGPYSLAIKAGYEPPQQTFFLVDSKRGRTGTWPIFLE
jgi:hypothetical protein